jgi:hypothetical protein
MAKQITKDKTIQNAIASTSRYRKEEARKELLKKEGKSSVNREYDFNNDVNGWLSDKDVNSVFTGEFKQHVDVNKKVLDVIQKLHPNANVKDYPYEINTDGSINYKKYADIMQRQGIKAVDEGQIKTAVNAVLDANDYDELASQGRYNYRDYDVSTLQNAATKSYMASKLDYENKLNKLQRDRLTTTDIAQQLELDSSIDYYKSLLGDGKSPGALYESYNSTLEGIKNNPNQARSTLYTRNWLDQIANGFAYREISDEVLSNPGRADFWKVKEYELSQIKEANENYFKRENLKIAKANLLIAQSKEAREAADANKKLTGDLPYFVGSGDETTDNLESLKNYANHLGNLTTENDNILADLARRASTPNIKVKSVDILSNIEKYKNAQYVPKTDYEKQQFDRYIQNSNSKVTQEKLYEQYENEAYKELTGATTQSEAIDKMLKTRGSLVITLSNGSKSTVTPKEMLTLLSKEEKYTPPVQGAKTVIYLDEAKLTDREKEIKKALAGRYTVEGKVSPLVDTYINNFGKTVKDFRVLQSQVTEKVASAMAPLTGTFKTEQAAITFKDTNEKNRFIGELTNIAGANINTKVAGQNYTPKELIESIKNKNADDIETQLKRQGDKYFIQVVDKKTPGKVQIMPVGADFVATNPSLGTKYLNQGIDLSQTILSNGGSTNIYKNYDNAHYHNGMFGGYVGGKRTVTLPIVADLEESGGQLYPVFKLKVSSTKEPIVLNYPHPTDRQSFESIYLPSLDDAKVLKLFKTQYPNIEQLISR